MFSQEKRANLLAEYEKLKAKVIDPANMSDQRNYRKMMQRFNELEKILQAFERIDQLKETIADNKELIETENNAELLEMAKEENVELQIKLDKKKEELKNLLVPKDPNDAKDAIIEIRAGTGGDEAALFVADLYRMYSYFADKQGWKKNVISSNPIGVGGFKEIIFSLSGKDVYGTMRFESGVHRVQRVPETESSGRIHTSAVSVAVLPEANEIDIEINPNDLRIDVYRSSGHGGQSVNTTDSAVRITHVPTGIVVTCQDEKSQLKNKNKALQVLRSRLLDAEISKQEKERAANRKSQVGSGDRSAKIRTYNFPQSRVTDHRIKLTSYRLENILLGELQEFIEALKLEHKKSMINRHA